MAKSQQQQIEELKRLVREQQRQIDRLSSATGKQIKVSQRAIDAEIAEQNKGNKQLGKLFKQLNKPAKKKATKKAAKKQVSPKPTKQSSTVPSRGQSKAKPKKQSQTKTSAKQTSKGKTKKASPAQTKKKQQAKSTAKKQTRTQVAQQIPPGIKSRYGRSVYTITELTSREKDEIYNVVLRDLYRKVPALDKTLLPGQDWAFRVQGSDSYNTYRSLRNLMKEVNQYKIFEDVYKREGTAGEVDKFFEIVRIGRKPNKHNENPVKVAQDQSRIEWDDEGRRIRNRKRLQHVKQEDKDKIKKKKAREKQKIKDQQNKLKLKEKDRIIAQQKQLIKTLTPRKTR